MCITNTLFSHKAIHQATWYPPDMNAKPSLKNSVLVRHRLRPLVMDTRVFRGGGGALDSDHQLVIVTLCFKLEKRSSQRAGEVLRHSTAWEVGNETRICRGSEEIF